MLQFFLNPWLLLGIAGVGLPVMAHLLSRRRFDVVEWGAMQFLNPSRKTRRRLKLEELLLLALRIGLITLIVLAVTRPWIPGGWLTGYHSSGSRAVVIVIDGSNSMSRSDGVNSVHQNAIRRASEFLQTLSGDDSVALIDARDQPRAIIESPLRDKDAVAEEMRQVSPPGGACAMMSALEKGLSILGRSSASSREIVVFTDGQSNGWNAAQDAQWLRFDDLLKFPAVRPRVWVVNVASQLAPVKRNVSVGRIELSRELTVPGFPVRLRVAVRNESDGELQIPVRLMLDGQRLAGESQTTTVPAHSESLLEFDHTVIAHGAHVLSVETEVPDDAISVDNVSHAAIFVADSLPVLLINGTSSSIESERATYFADLAFAPLEQRPAWITAKVRDAAEVTTTDFKDVSAVIVANVARLSPTALIALRDFVQEGNGLLIACGPQTTPDSFRTTFADAGLLPQLEVVRVRETGAQSGDAVRVAPLTIQPGWLDRFKSDPGRSFLKASYSGWVLFKPAFRNANENITAPQPAEGIPDAPSVLAQLTTGDPLILESRCGEGVILLMTTSLDRTWTDLPTRSDYVPFLHEAVFHTASARSHRNVEFGEPLLAEQKVPPGATPEPVAGQQEAEETEERDAVFAGPDGSLHSIPVSTENDRLTAAFRDTMVPGIYRTSFTPEDEEEKGIDELFVVNYDHSEDELARLSNDDKARLITNDRVRFSENLADLTKSMYGDETITELWAALLTIFLLFLVAELLLTRRAIRKGYGGENRAEA